MPLVRTRDDCPVEQLGVEREDVVSQQARDAAMWRAVRDLTRIAGQVVLIDRIDTAIVAVGGVRQTSDGEKSTKCAWPLDLAVERACDRLGIDCNPRGRALISPGGQGSTEEGGP